MEKLYFNKKISFLPFHALEIVPVSLGSSSPCTKSVQKFLDKLYVKSVQMLPGSSEGWERKQDKGLLEEVWDKLRHTTQQNQAENIQAFDVVWINFIYKPHTHDYLSEQLFIGNPNWFWLFSLVFFKPGVPTVWAKYGLPDTQCAVSWISPFIRNWVLGFVAVGENHPILQTWSKSMW